MDRPYDVIVLGLGGMGSAALSQLARRGQRVLGIEQFPLVHERGSSHGQTRIIRTAYYEDPCYVPLLRRAFALWHDLEQRTGRHLLTRCDCLTLGPDDGELLTGVRTAARDHSLALHELGANVPERYPAFHLPPGMQGAYETEAGYLYVEDCVRAHLDDARTHGASIHAEEPVLGWEANASGVTVRTALGEYHAERLIITAGAWATRLLADLGVPFSVMRQTLLWFPPKHPERFRRDRFPIFIAETDAGAFYGLPMIDPRGVKVARHYGAPELSGPESVDWTVYPEDETPVRAFLDRVFPGEFGPCFAGQVCMYTLTPDRHFVIDRHPAHERVVAAAGFSGHGFKFASVVGEILADLVLEGKTAWPIDPFRATRFA